uniref:Uncharacterized protein n=1 Tax=Anguilla anguilla TaxID=7936 RepID=A0A0E9S045_ANGAN
MLPCAVSFSARNRARCLFGFRCVNCLLSCHCLCRINCKINR